jgi:hypothetical protein
MSYRDYCTSEAMSIYQEAAGYDAVADLRTIVIPEVDIPQKLKDAQWSRKNVDGDTYPCACCGLPVPKPKFYVHMIDGGGIALHPDDEALYTDDGGDMGLQPVGTDCLKRHPELKPFVQKA